MSSFGAAYSTDSSSVTFQLWAPRATRVELWIYATPISADAMFKLPINRESDGIWTGTVSVAQLYTAALTATIYYGCRAWRPNWPFNAAWTPGSSAGFVSDGDTAGNRLNPNKLLPDRYALEISHNPETRSHHNPTSYQSGTQFRVIDTGLFAPKGIVLDFPRLDFGTKPTRALKDDIIYEVHLRGLTKNDPSVPANLKGTYGGAAYRAHYSADLGVMAVEFRPIHETQNGLNDSPEFPCLHNYWGYNSVNDFAPHRRYSSDQISGGPIGEWIAMAKAFHAAGVKVFVDVVYNHHEEYDVDAATGTIGRLFTVRGLDNPNYYEARSPSLVNLNQNDNGVGPNLNCATTPVRNMVLDSLKYWTNVMGVDGFRFDLAAALGNADST